MIKYRIALKFELSDIYLCMEWKNHIEFTYEISDFARRLCAKKKELDAYRPIPEIAIRSIKEALTLEWTYHSNSIEGNSLTLRETKVILEEGMTIKGKSLREHFEAVNHQEAIEFVEQLAHPDYVLKTKDILDVHALVLQKIEKEFAGRFRTAGVRIGGANFIPPNALKVSDFMDELIEWINLPQESEIDSIIHIAVFHHRFVWIHPFFDGNGRTVRLIFNLLLMKLGFPPAIILQQDRKKYYEALNKANDGDYSKIILLVFQAIERSLTIYLSALNNNQEDYQPISNIVNDPGVEYGQEYIGLLARSGKIEAFKEGKVWFTSKEAIINYQQQRKRTT